MDLRGPAVAIFLIVILAYAHQASVESNIIVTPGEGSPDVIREDNVRVLEWWEVSPVHYLVSFIALYVPLLVPLGCVLATLAGLSFGIRMINQNNVLENNRRQEIFRMIKENPGTSLTEIKNMTGINRSSLKYHLEILMREEKITSGKMSKTRHYFENDDRYSLGAMKARLVLNCRTTKEVFRYIHMNPGCTHRDLTGHTEFSGSTIFWHIERLHSVDLVTIRKENYQNRYYVEKSTAVLVYNLGLQQKESEFNCNS